MATYNGASFITEQLDSILCQLNDWDEIIISDDGSSDDTLAIIEAYNDKRIKIFKHIGGGKNPWDIIGGDKKCYLVSKNFDNALRHCNGQYIFLCDQDDMWTHDKVQKMIEVMQSHPDCCVVCNSVLVDVNGKVISKPLRPKNVNLSLKHQLLHPMFSGCTMAFDSKFKKRIVPMPRWIPSHDFFIGLTAIVTKRLYLLDEPLHLYRSRNGENTSASINNSLLFKIAYRQYTLHCIFWRMLIVK